MAVLTLRLQLHHDEAATSFMSRLARHNGAISSRQFAGHLGLSHQGVVDGDPAALEALGTMTRTSPDQLSRQSIIRDQQGYSLGAERLAKSSLRRDPQFVCPCCLNRDLQDGLTAAYGRNLWSITHIRSCPEHAVELVELHCPREPHDFSAILDIALGGGKILERVAAPADASRFEQYVKSRVQAGKTEPNWLDAIELHAAARTCEVFGAIAMKGIWPGLRKFTSSDWRKAADAGFEIARRGVVAIREFLSDLQRLRISASTGHDRAQAAYGHLYDWASRGSVHPAYEPVRQLMFDHIVETMPVRGGEIILGRTVDQRRVHTVRSIEIELGVHPKRMRRILQSTGLVESGSSDGATWVDAAKAESLTRSLQDSLSLLEARSRLGADRVHTSLLHKAGYIASITSTGGRLAFRTADLDELLARLHADAIPVDEAPANAAPIPSAAKRSNCSAMEIVKLILDRKLNWVGALAGHHGYGAVLVNYLEVRTHVRGSTSDALPARAIIKEMKTNYKVVDALITQGVLPSETRTNPLNRCPTVMVARKDFEAFRAEHGTLTELAAEAGLHPRRLRADLETRGVRPSLSAEVFFATFYRRQDV